MTGAPAGPRPPGDPWAPGDARPPWAPAGARPPGGAPRHAGPAAYAQPSAQAAYAQPRAQAQAFSFNAARWTTTERVTGAGTLVLLISLFLPWFTARVSLGPMTSSSSADALTAHRYLYLVLIMALLTIGYLVVYAGWDAPGLRANHERLLVAATGINLLLVLIAVVFKPPGVTPMVHVGWNLGAFVGLIAAIVAVAPLANSARRARR